MLDDDKCSRVDEDFDDGEEDGVEDGGHDVCNECQAEDAYGWADRRQKFCCYRCWKQYNMQWGPERDHCGFEVPETAQPPVRYEKLDPVARPAEHEPCEIVILEVDALSQMQLLKDGSTCLVVLGSNINLPKPAETRQAAT